MLIFFKTNNLNNGWRKDNYDRFRKWFLLFGMMRNKLINVISDEYVNRIILFRVGFKSKILKKRNCNN
jgi:hypothetical protein